MATESQPVAIQVQTLRSQAYLGYRKDHLMLRHRRAPAAEAEPPQRRIIVPPVMAAELRAICNLRRRNRQIEVALTSSANVALIATFTLRGTAREKFEACDDERQDKLLFEVAEAIAKRLRTSVAGLVWQEADPETAPQTGGRETGHGTGHIVMPGYDHSGNSIGASPGKERMAGVHADAAAVLAPAFDRPEENTPGDAAPDIAPLDLMHQIERLREENRRLRAALADAARERDLLRNAAQGRYG